MYDFIELLHSCQATQHVVSKLCLHLTIIIIIFFFLRVFFGINPEWGSKAEKKGKKQHFIPPQVCKLVTQLKEFECKQKESEWAIWAVLKAQKIPFWTESTHKNTQRQIQKHGTWS